MKFTQKLCTGGVLCRLKVTNLGVFNGSSGSRINPDSLNGKIYEKAREFGTASTFKAVVDHFKAQIEDQSSRIDQHMARVAVCDEIKKQGHCNADECEEWKTSSFKRFGKNISYLLTDFLFKLIGPPLLFRILVLTLAHINRNS